MDYILTFRLPNVMDEEFLQTIPMHRAKVNTLIEAGVIKSYSVSLKRDKLWMVIDANDENEIESIVDSLPLNEYLQDYNYESLMFTLTANTEMPHISLN